MERYHLNSRRGFFILKERLKELWNFKIFRAAVFLHSFYFILAVILTLIFFRNQNDFIVFMKAGEIFMSDPRILYNQDNYLWDFRYLPLVAIFFIPFYLAGFDLGFVLFNTLSLVLNIYTSVLIYKIALFVRHSDHEKNDDRVILYTCFYLMGVPHVFNYILGQFNVPFIFVILLSLYILLKKNQLKWQLVAGILIGLSIIFKPISLALVPFLLIIQLNVKQKKIIFDFPRSFMRILGVLIPSSLNVLLFYLYPEMFEGFMITNFTGASPIRINFSFSITKLIINFCYVYNIPFNQLQILFVVGAIVAGVAFFAYLLGEPNQYKIIYGYVLGILIQLLVFYDSWDHHLLNLTPLLIILMFNLPRHSKMTTPYFKRGFFFLNFFDLLFMSFWFLTAPYFPYNFYSTVFLIIIFIGTCKCCVFLDKILGKSEKGVELHGEKN